MNVTPVGEQLLLFSSNVFMLFQQNTTSANVCNHIVLWWTGIYQIPEKKYLHSLEWLEKGWIINYLKNLVNKCLVWNEHTINIRWILRTYVHIGTCTYVGYPVRTLDVEVSNYILKALGC
jgi:hypothetical protein